METKDCRVCGNAKPVDQFRKGHRRCNDCTADYLREYRLRNRAAVREREQDWYRRNREAKLEYRRQYWAANYDAIQERRQKWYRENAESERERNGQKYRENAEALREYARRYTKERPTQNCVKAHRRRARVQLLEVSAVDVDYMEVLRRDPCAYCGAEAGTVDHIEPLYSGGNGRWENLTASCRSCNSSKNTATLLAFLGRAK